jgi:beta-lactamase regulating signal transducer with metallopeptidase domain/biopolymer transport protein ExbD
MNTLLNPFVTASAKGAAWLFVWSWQAAVLLACVWAGLKIFRVKAPTLRHQVWLFALIAVAAMPALSGVVQSLPLPQPSIRALSYAVELPRVVVINDAAPIVQAPAPAPSGRPSITKPIILSLSFAVWLWGMCAFVMRAAINGLRLHCLRAGARRVSLADLDCNECDCEALRAGKASLALSDKVCSPILLGVLRPMIVFPADIASWTSPMERRAMLRHELAHVERRDHYVNLFQTFLGAVFFFHPLARYACRQLTVEREMACDDHVVGSGAEAESYAESIIKAAERGIGAPRGAHQLALFSTRQILERRIEMILSKDRARMVAHQWRYLILSGAMITAISALLISSGAGQIAAQPISKSDEQTHFNNSDRGEEKNYAERFTVEMIKVNEQRRDVPPPPPPPPPRRHSKDNPPPPPPPPPPDPWALVVKVAQGGGSYKLNNIDVPSLEDLRQRLNNALSGRPANKKTVLVEGSETIADEEVAKVFDTIRSAGGMPRLFWNPLSLVVTISQGGGRYKLNGINFTSLEDLGQRLNNALRGRPADKKTVYVKAPEIIPDEEVVKVFNAITAAGGQPIRIKK